MKKGIKQKKTIILSILMFCLIILLLTTEKVNAESLNLYLENSERQITVAPYARFYTLSGTTATASTTGTSTDLGYYATQDTVTQSGSGELICFDTGSALLQGVTYQFSIYLGSQDSDMYFRGNIHYGIPSIGPTLAVAKDYWEDLDYGITKNYNSNTNGTIGLVNSEGYVYYYTNILLYVITPTRTGSSLCIPFNGANKTNTSYTIFYGFTYDVLGNLDTLTTSEIQSAVKSSGLATASSVSEVNDAVEELQTEVQAMQEEQEKTNEKLDEQIQQDKEQHDEFMNSDINEEDKELPDDSKYNDYGNAESDLKDKVDQADLSNISIGIDANSSSWVWDTLTDLIKSHSIIFGMFIAILSIGIIKLALGR